MATRKKLPNLKICVDNTESSDESDIEVQESDSSSSSENETPNAGAVRSRGGLEDGEVYDDDDNDVLSIGSTQPTERRFLSRRMLRQNKTAFEPKVYENKSGNFVTGIDITSEEASEKREKRAHRFGTLSTPKQPITDIDIKNLYRSLGMNMETLDQDPRGWRMEAILLRGTENMSTEDVFSYFSEYAPKGIEWIDDFSCNVLWLDKLTPARAFLKLSSSWEEVQKAEKLVDDQMEEAQSKGISPLKRDQKDDLAGDTNEADVTTSSDTSQPQTHTVPAVQNSDTSTPTTTARHTQDEKDGATVDSELVLNVLEEETMELDYDDNLDLTGDDPIDKALSTWENFTQNKKQRAERAAETAQRKQTDIRGSRGGLSEKEKMSQNIPEKDEDDSANKMTEVNNIIKDKGSEKLDSQKKSKDPADQMEVEDENRKNDAKIHKKDRDIGRKKESTSKEERMKKSKDTDKSIKMKTVIKKEKMETEDGSESDSSSSSSSSSGSSSSGSSSDSDSESGSGSNSSASSSSSSSSSSNGSKKKKKMTRSERDQEKETKRLLKKPTAPPIPPPSREKSEIPWPPGWWRLGVPHAKAEYLFMRYAMKADKKLPGAEKRSQYYVKYGNPNFGGIKGLISNSRKRKMRYMDREKDEDMESLDSSGVRRGEKRQALGPLTGGQSRLAGRLGVRGKDHIQRRRRDEEEAEEENERPRLKEGKDLRDILNRETSAYKTEPVQSHTAGVDSDDEMDYGAELERLMGEGPPTKKRFMRMHADDEEEKIQAKRLAVSTRETGRWERGVRNYDDNEDDYVDDLEEEGEVVDEEEEEEERFPRRKGYVDYDNVEDDDPFNLFGTARAEPSPPSGVLRGADSDEGEEDYSGRFRGEERKFAQPHRAAGGGIDLRAKLQSLHRVKNRHY